MSAIDVVNRVFREFRRYTGDGLPGEPANAELPVGDPTSGVHVPKKVEIRAALLAPIGEAQDAADRAEQAVAAAIAMIVPDGSVTRAKLSTLLSKMVPVSVFEYGAVGDGSTDDGPAFEAAQSAAVSAGSKLVVVPAESYRINTTIDIVAGVTWLFLGAELTTTNNTGVILSADTVADWALLGKLTLRGNLTTPATTTQTGLKVENCSRYLVEGVTATAFKGKGFHVLGTDAVTLPRGRNGQFSNCAAHGNTVGRQIDAGASAEYTLWTNWQATGNVSGDVIGAGNTTTVGGNVVDNTDGVVLTAGANHGHGRYVGVQINHNTRYNVSATDVTNGFQFLGCDFYSNNDGYFSSAIYLDGCDGISFIGGVLASNVYCWAKNVNHRNAFRDMYLPGDYDTVQKNIDGPDYDVDTSIFAGCFGPGAVDADGYGINNERPTVVISGGSRSGGTRDVVLVKNDDGDYTITWPVAMPDDGYSLAVTAVTDGDAAGLTHSLVTHTASSVRICTFTQDGDTTTQVDCTKLILTAG